MSRMHNEEEVTKTVLPTIQNCLIHSFKNIKYQIDFGTKKKAILTPLSPLLAV